MRILQWDLFYVRFVSEHIHQPYERISSKSLFSKFSAAFTLLFHINDIVTWSTVIFIDSLS